MAEVEQNAFRVVGVESISPSLFFLVLERNGLEFVPGDCVVLHTDAGPSRSYSIASGNNCDTLRFLIREFEGGEVSPWLARRRAGDLVKVSPPFGWFRPGQHGNDVPFFFIATGTGIAPFLSYRETFPERPPKGVLYGVRSMKEAAGFARLDGWCDVQLSVSREQHPKHHHGHLTDLISGLSGHSGANYYLCGRERMVVQSTALLEAQGVEFHQIHREVFFND